jgi:hypothetical protein
MRGLLRKKCQCGEQIIQINKACVVLIEALEGGYKYSKNNKTGKTGDKPIKDKYYDDIADAWRYGVENFCRFGIPYAYDRKVSTAYRKHKPWDWMEKSPEEFAKMLI